MKHIKTLLKTSCLLALTSISAVAGATNLSSADVNAIHSATFDGGAPAPDGNFIPAPTGTNVTFTNVGTNNGGVTATGKGVIEYDGTTARLLTVLLPDLDITINNLSDTATVTTTGASITITGPDLDTEGNGQFQVDGGGSIVADFSTFPEVVLSCSELNGSGTICPGIGQIIGQVAIDRRVDAIRPGIAEQEIVSVRRGAEGGLHADASTRATAVVRHEGLAEGGFRLPVNAGVEPVAGMAPMFHSGKFALVDTDGRVRGYYDYRDKLEVNRLREDIRELAAASGS